MFLVSPTSPGEWIFFLVVLLFYMAALFPFWMVVYEEFSGRSRHSNQCHWPYPRCKDQCRHARHYGKDCPRFRERQN